MHGSAHARHLLTETTRFFRQERPGCDPNKQERTRAPPWKKIGSSSGSYAIVMTASEARYHHTSAAASGMKER